MVLGEGQISDSTAAIFSSDREVEEDRQPFVIRSHHLVFIYPVLSNRATPEEVVAVNISNTERYRTLNLYRIFPRNVEYADDVLGNSPEEADKFRRDFTAFLRQFSELPDDYPVKIAEGKKDKICGGCAIGAHCDQGPRSSRTKSLDYYAREAFITKAIRLGFKDDIAVIDEDTTYFNGKPRKIKHILTTAGIAKKVILRIGKSIPHKPQVY